MTPGDDDTPIYEQPSQIEVADDDGTFPPDDVGTTALALVRGLVPPGFRAREDSMAAHPSFRRAVGCVEADAVEVEAITGVEPGTPVYVAAADQRHYTGVLRGVTLTAGFPISLSLDELVTDAWSPPSWERGRAPRRIQVPWGVIARIEPRAAAS
jgi:hypothetical protein